MQSAEVKTPQSLYEPSGEVLWGQVSCKKLDRGPWRHGTWGWKTRKGDGSSEGSKLAGSTR